MLSYKNLHCTDLPPTNNELLLINIGIGGAIATIGGWFHRKKRPFRPFKNFIVGGIGGALHFQAKKNVGEAGIDRLDLDKITLSPIRAWTSKIMTNIGTSMVENAVHNRPWNHSFSMDVGPLYLTMRQNENREWQFQKRLHVGATLSTLHFLAKGYKLDLKNSLRTGSSVFQADNFSGLKSSLPEAEIGAGTNIYGSIVVKDDKGGLLTHEIIHAYQNRFLDALSPYSSYEGINNFYLSWGRLIGTPRWNQSYENNWFEKEAHSLDQDGFYFRSYSQGN